MPDNVKRPNPVYDKPFNRHLSKLFQKRLGRASANEPFRYKFEILLLKFILEYSKKALDILVGQYP